MISVYRVVNVSDPHYQLVSLYLSFNVKQAVVCSVYMCCTGLRLEEMASLYKNLPLEYIRVLSLNGTKAIKIADSPILNWQ